MCSKKLVEAVIFIRNGQIEEHNTYVEMTKGVSLKGLSSKIGKVACFLPVTLGAQLSEERKILL